MKIRKIVKLLVFQNCANVIYKFSLRLSKVPVTDKKLAFLFSRPNCREGVIVEMG